MVRVRGKRVGNVVRVNVSGKSGKGNSGGGE